MISKVAIETLATTVMYAGAKRLTRRGVSISSIALGVLLADQAQAACVAPALVGATVKAHYPRMALTRAKSRTLRDALQIGLAALEELADE